MWCLVTVVALPLHVRGTFRAGDPGVGQRAGDAQLAEIWRMLGKALMATTA
jgi:hypothetical protein